MADIIITQIEILNRRKLLYNQTISLCSEYACITSLFNSFFAIDVNNFALTTTRMFENE